MSYRKRIVYSGNEPEYTLGVHKTIFVYVPDKSEPEWKTIATCEKCQRYVKCVYQGAPCCLPKSIEPCMRRAKMTCSGDVISINMLTKNVNEISRIIRIIGKVVKGQMR